MAHQPWAIFCDTGVVRVATLDYPNRKGTPHPTLSPERRGNDLAGSSIDIAIPLKKFMKRPQFLKQRGHGHGRFSGRERGRRTLPNDHFKLVETRVRTLDFRYESPQMRHIPTVQLRQKSAQPGK